MRNFLSIGLSLIVVAAALTAAPAQPARAASFIVNSTADAVDVAPGNGVCETATAGQCTLRAAIQEANALAGDDSICSLSRNV
ncbi:MAG: CSLREA domain-containing protein [Chloroflexi bacterium]|nr:CSLREA domain-containing protein [Chloroflexota bacterium]